MMSLMNKFYYWRLLHIWLHKMTETSKGSYHVQLYFPTKGNESCRLYSRRPCRYKFYFVLEIYLFIEINVFYEWFFKMLMLLSGRKLRSYQLRLGKQVEKINLNPSYQYKLVCRV